MYDIISNIINHIWIDGSGSEEYIYIICGALIIIFTCVVIDLFYRVFSHFWR